MSELVDVVAFLIGLAAIAIGIGGALSPWWASAVIGVIVVSTVFVSRMGGRKA